MSTRLRIELALHEISGPRYAAGILLVTGLLSAIGSHVYLAELQRTKSSELASLRAAATPAPLRIAPLESRQRAAWSAFQDNLGDPTQTSRYLEQIFLLADQRGVLPHKGVYHFDAAPAHAFVTYTAELPLEGDYPAIRGFLEDTLLQIPFAALDTIDFKRDSVASGSVQASVRLTLYLRANAESRNLAVSLKGEP